MRLSTIQKCLVVSLFVLILAVILFASCSRLLRRGDGRWETADFEGVPRTGKAPLEVTFTDKSYMGALHWDWWFEGGTPEESKDVGPHTVIYKNPGEYDVSLSILFPVPDDSIPHGDMAYKKKYIKVTP